MESRARHLVLGGSAGIGFAYAERYARRGDDLNIVARDTARLDEARRKLVSVGAHNVETRSSNLADPGARAALFAQLISVAPFSTVFVGGPGPAAGRVDEVSDEDHVRARQVCLAYPRDIFGLCAELIEVGGQLVLLSSSAADEPLKGHRFYLSALYRRQLDRLVAEAADQYGVEWVKLVVLKPTVVLTPLSERFALRMRPSQTPRQTLSRYFNVGRVRTATDYILDASAALTPKRYNGLRGG